MSHWCIRPPVFATTFCGFPFGFPPPPPLLSFSAFPPAAISLRSFFPSGDFASGRESAPAAPPSRSVRTLKAYCDPTTSPSTLATHCPSSAADAGSLARSCHSPPAGPSRTNTRYSTSARPPVQVGARQPMVMAPPAASTPPSTTSGGDVGKFGSGEP